MKLLAGIAIAFLLAFIAYYKQGSEPQDAKGVIEQGIVQVKKTRNLTPDAESLLKVQLAIVDHVAQVGHPPDSLTDLVPTYFDEVPINPGTGKVFAYRRNGMSFKLGKQLEKEGAPIALAQSSSEASASSEAGTLLDQLDFVNPNTLELEEFIYNAEGKRDPFQRFNNAPKQVSDEELSPLQRLSLGQLRLTAVLEDSKGEPTAIVEDSAGKGFTIRVGTLIGPDNGTVGTIEKDKVKIVQTRIDFAGNKTQNIVELKINQKQ